MGRPMLIYSQASGGKLRKEVAGMKTPDIIQLLILVLEAITLGLYIATFVVMVAMK